MVVLGQRLNLTWPREAAVCFGGTDLSVFQGIEHVGLVCKDTTSLAKWYAEVFGLKEVYNNKKTPPTLFYKAPNGMMIEFVPTGGKTRLPSDEKDEGWRHVAIKVTNIQSAMAKLDERRVEWVGDLKESPQTGVKARFFRDPEGNILHIIERTMPL